MANIEIGAGITIGGGVTLTGGAAGPIIYNSSNGWTTATYTSSMGIRKLNFTGAVAAIQAVTAGTNMTITTSEGSANIQAANNYNSGTGSFDFVFTSGFLSADTLLTLQILP